jgi:spermidine/putrescine transport system permease protein
MQSAAVSLSRRSRQDLRVRAGLLAPSLAVVAFGLVLPLCIVLVYSLLTPGTFGGVIWTFSWDAYIQFLFERDIFDESLTFSTAYLEIFLRSFLQSVVATAACFLLGFPTAYFIATRPERTRLAWLFVVTIPYWVNLLVRTISMLFLVRDEGPLNQLLMWAGIIGSPIHIAYTNLGIGLALVYTYLPFMVLPIYAAIERLDLRLIEAARDLYAGRWTVLWKIIVPLARPGIIAGSLLVFIPCLGNFLAPDLLGGGKKLMIGNLIALQFQSSRNWPFGSAVAVILMAAVMVALMAYVRIARRGNAGAH